MHYSCNNYFNSSRTSRGIHQLAEARDETPVSNTTATFPCSTYVRGSGELKQLITVSDVVGRSVDYGPTCNATFAAVNCSFVKQSARTKNNIPAISNWL